MSSKTKEVKKLEHKLKQLTQQLESANEVNHIMMNRYCYKRECGFLTMLVIVGVIWFATHICKAAA